MGIAGPSHGVESEANAKKSSHRPVRHAMTEEVKQEPGKDHGGDGGMYDGKYGISMMDVTDYVLINKNDNNFGFGLTRFLDAAAYPDLDEWTDGTIL